MSEKRQAPHLLNESPILVYPTLAVALGINKAVVFQQLHFLLNGQKTSNNTYNFVDDLWWVYNSYPEWRRDYFPWLSISSLKGIFNQLEDEKLVIARQSMKHKSDRRKWYTIDYGVWDKFCLIIGQKVSNEPSDKKYPLVGQKVANGYSKTSSKTSTESKNAPKVAITQKNCDALIDVWAGILHLDMDAMQSDFHTKSARRHAKEMLLWVRPPTPAEFETSFKECGKDFMPFEFLSGSIIKIRARPAAPVNPAHVPFAPAETIPDAVPMADEARAAMNKLTKTVHVNDEVIHAELAKSA